METIDKVKRLIRAATGEDYGDGYTVTDVVIGYAEPGYRVWGGEDPSTTVVVFGNWNPKRFPREGDAPLTKEENIGPRLCDALERAGASIEWLDEWAQCGNCYRAMRTTADSYSWTMYGTFSENIGEYTCADCLREDLDSALEEYENNAENAVTWLSAADMRQADWTQYEAHNPREYESGWHPGQDDNPKTILAEVLRDVGESARVVFLINGVGQFDMRFSVWYKVDAQDEDTEESE